MMKTETMMKVYTLTFQASWEGSDLLGIYSTKEKAEAEAKRLREEDDDIDSEYSSLIINEVNMDDAAQDVGNSSLLGVEV
jgi:hypothetical protein